MRPSCHVAEVFLILLDKYATYVGADMLNNGLLSKICSVIGYEFCAE